MKKIGTFILLAVSVILYGCSKTDFSSDIIEDEATGDKLAHDEIVLGAKLDDPYSVENVTKALASLYPVKADRVDVTPTDIYVRFLPIRL